MFLGYATVLWRLYRFTPPLRENVHQLVKSKNFNEKIFFQNMNDTWNKLVNYLVP